VDHWDSNPMRLSVGRPYSLAPSRKVQSSLCQIHNLNKIKLALLLPGQFIVLLNKILNHAVDHLRHYPMAL